MTHTVKKIVKATVKALPVLAMLVALPHAQAGEFFIGVNTGTSNFKQLEEECDDLFDGNSGSLSCLSVDDSDTIMSINAGYNFNSILGLEVGYVDLGEYSAEVNFRRVNVTPSAEVDFIYAAAVLTLPLTEKFSISGRLGGVSADLEASLPSGVSTELEDETLAFVGASLDYRLLDKLSLQIRHDTLTDLDLTSVGLRYHF